MKSLLLIPLNKDKTTEFNFSEDLLDMENDFEINRVIGVVPRKRGANRLSRVALFKDKNKRRLLSNGKYAPKFKVGSLAVDNIMEVIVWNYYRSTYRSYYWNRKKKAIPIKSIYYKVKTSTEEYLELEEMTIEEVIQYIKRRQSQTVSGGLPKLDSLDSSDLEELYTLYVNDKEDLLKVKHLADLIQKLDIRVRAAITSKKVHPDIQKKWPQIKKLRDRAAHETTSVHERETCLRFAIARMEAVLPKEILPDINIEKAFNLQQAGEEIPVIKPVEKKKPSVVKKANKTWNELMPLAEAVAKQIQNGTVTVKAGSRRATIFYDQYKNGSQNFITFTGSVGKVRMFSPYITADMDPETDSKGYLYLTYKNVTVDDVLPSVHQIVNNFQTGIVPWRDMVNTKH